MEANINRSNLNIFFLLLFSFISTGCLDQTDRQKLGSNIFNDNRDNLNNEEPLPGEDSGDENDTGIGDDGQTTGDSGDGGDAGGVDDGGGGSVDTGDSGDSGATDDGDGGGDEPPPEKKIFSDNFNRSSIGNLWNISWGNNISLIYNDILALSQGNASFLSYSNVVSKNQFSKIILADGFDPNVGVQVFVRLRSSDNARYAFHWDGDQNNANGSQWEIKYDGVSTANVRKIGTIASNSPPSAGDELKLEVFDNGDPSRVFLNAYLNGNLLISVEDISGNRILGTGPMGVVFRKLLGSNGDFLNVSYPAPIITDWIGGEF